MTLLSGTCVAGLHAKHRLDRTDRRGHWRHRLRWLASSHRCAQQFYPAYLTAFFYWLSLSLGCMGIAMIHGMTGGGWGRMIRRVVEAGYETLPLMALLFLPVWLNVASIYEWTDPEFVRHHESLVRKAGYLNVVGFQCRAIAPISASGFVITWFLNRFVAERRTRGRFAAQSSSAKRSAGIGFMAYGFTLTLAAVDWAMSLEPTWYSTMYGLIHIAGQGVSGLSFPVLIVIFVFRNVQALVKDRHSRSLE